MPELSIYSIFFGSVLLCTAVAGALRAALLASCRRAGGKQSLPPDPVEHELPPAELAYLLRDGDMSHTMIVLVVDLVQRAVKAQSDTQPLALRPYERQVWTNVTEFVKRWAHQKVNEVIPIKAPKNPIQWFIRARALKTFVGETLRTFVKEVVKDPRHLKRYFSIGGIARLAVELYTSTARQGVETELRKELLARGLLIAESRRKSCATQIAVLIPALVAAVIVTNPNFIATISPPAFIAFAFMGLLNGFILQLLIAIPGFIPSYDEFAKVAAELARQGFRLTLVRTVLRLSKIVVVVIGIVLSLILLTVELGANALLFHLEGFHALALIVPLTIMSVFIFRLMLDVHHLLVNETPSAGAQQMLRHTQARLAEASPLSSFGKVLSDPEYDATFSELVALYGIETLWLLS